MEDIHLLFDKYSTEEIIYSSGDSEIGKFVEIVSVGATYSSYEEIAKKMDSKHWDRGHCPEKGDTGIIVATAKHRTENIPLYLIRIKDNGETNEYIMGREGFKIQK